MTDAAKRSSAKSRDPIPPPAAAKGAGRRRVVVVAEKPERFPRELAVDAATYLSGKDSTEDPGLTVVNFCRSDRYLSQGYYVSLLADARGQKVLPSIDTLEALSSVPEALRLLEDVGVPTFHGSGDDRRRTMTRLAALSRDAKQPDVIEELSVFGRASRKEIARVAARIHRRFPVPVCRLSFAKIDGTWRLFHLEPVPLDRVENGARELVAQAVASGKLFAPSAVPRLAEARASLAVLFDTGDPFKPSDQATLDRLERVASRQGLRVTRIALGDLDRVSEHDALFIRCLTGPDLPAFRFAQRAEALGIPVIDDTRSILRCGNKVYLAELLSRAHVPVPRTAIVQRGTTYEHAVLAVGAPFVLKVPDGSFSTAVYKVPSAEVWNAKVPELLASSPMLIAQEWAPTAFDWRVGVLDGRPLYACRYWMVPGHWQIRGSTSGGAARDGRVEGVPLDHTPASVKRVACRAARLIGDGLYGVDVKELESGAVVIEVNDNPDVNLDYEDQAEGDRVYEELSAWFLKRIDQDGARREPRPPGDAPHPERAPIGRVPRDLDHRDYRAYEVCGLEMEYALVDRDLEPQHLAEEALAAIAGRSTSEVELGVVAFSNEFFDHLLEMKTHVPLRSLCESEQALAEGAARLARQLERLGARAMPTSMHPWLDPRWAQRWTRSGRNVYDTYARLFDTATHGWANVQSCQVNLPLGREHEAVAMLNASALLLPYVPAIAASSPMYGGELRPAVDNRLAFILEHQLRLPESQGEIVPEYTTSLAAYRRDVLKPIFAAVDRLDNAETIRHEWLNARGAVFKFSRRSMEVRVVDSQECVKMDVAIAAFIRGALHDLSAELIRGRLRLPAHATLVEDFRACVREGSAARVWAPHVLSQSRGDDGKLAVGVVIQHFIERAERRLKRSEEQYLELVGTIRERGSLSERIAARLSPFAGTPALREEARAVYLELCDCLENNRVWEGRHR